MKDFFSNAELEEIKDLVEIARNGSIGVTCGDSVKRTKTTYGENIEKLISGVR